MKTILLETHYFPCLEYMATIATAEMVFLEAHENFIKQTARNRCYIRTSNNVLRLSVPVVSQAPCSIQNVAIDTSQNWQNQHWRSICSAYGKSPFFAFFKDDLQGFFEKKYESLWEWNLDLLTFCLKTLRIPTKIGISKSYEKMPVEPILDKRAKFDSTKACIDMPKSYFQVFGNDFVKNLSILDLLFCEGTHAKTYLEDLGRQLDEK